MKGKSEKKRVVGYCRVSTTRQDLDRQKATILEYSNKNGWQLQEMFEATVSTRKNENKRGIGLLRVLAGEGQIDAIVFSELSRLGRSVGELSRLVDEFVALDVELHFVKESMVLRNGKRDIASKVMLTTFSLLAEIERDLISERTKDGLAARRAAGVKLGRPAKKSKLDPRKEEIGELLKLGVPQRRIAKRMECTPATLNRWLGWQGKAWRTKHRPAD